MKRPLGRKSAASASTDGKAAEDARRHRVVVWQRRIVVAALIIGVFVVAGLAGSVVRAQKDSAMAAPSGAASPSGLSLSQPGHTPVVLTLYEDMRDPASRAFQQTYGAELDKLLASGMVTLHYREVAAVDAAVGGSGSARAANALACAADVKLFTQYRSVLLAHQPAQESDDAFGSDAYLIKLSRRVPGLDTDVFRSCVDGVGHTVWVKTGEKDFAASGLGSVPVLQLQVSGLSGSSRSLPVSGSGALGPQGLWNAVLQAVQTAPTSQVTATASAS
jgi:uncharacterized membrane protein